VMSPIPAPPAGRPGQETAMRLPVAGPTEPIQARGARAAGHPPTGSAR
jgi:hypothetical protein